MPVVLTGRGHQNLTHLTRDKRLERRIVEEPIKNSNGFYKMRFECQRVSTFFFIRTPCNSSF